MKYVTLPRRLGALKTGDKFETPKDIEIMSNKFQAHGRPPPVEFNKARNIDKAAYVLKGIIDGVNVDDNLVDTEILYLDAWMRSQNSLGLQVVAFDLYQALNGVLEDQNMTDQVRIDFNQLIEDVLEVEDQNRTPGDKLCINEFLSMLESICTNGAAVQPESQQVDEWITANPDISKGLPIQPVHHQICDAALDDGAATVDVIDDEELDRLDEMVTKLSSNGHGRARTANVNGSIGQVFCDDVDHLTFEGKTFCFTGNFLRGSENQNQIEAEIRGAKISTSVTTEVDVLVVGSVTDQNWRYQNFDKKIEQAMSLRTLTGSPSILSEDQWISLLNNSKQYWTKPGIALF